MIATLENGLHAAVLWVKDTYRGIRYGRTPRPYGVEILTGPFGKGKTVSLVREGVELRRRWGDRIKIATNFGLLCQDVALTDWREILLPERRAEPWVYLIDELELIFDSRKWADFPSDFFGVISQCRKYGQGVRVVASAPHWDDIDVRLRRITRYAIEVRSYFGARWVWHRRYDGYSYSPEKAASNLIKAAGSFNFVAVDELREQYDTHALAHNINQVDPEAVREGRAARAGRAAPAPVVMLPAAAGGRR